MMRSYMKETMHNWLMPHPDIRGTTMLKHDGVQPGEVGDKPELLHTAARSKVGPCDSNNYSNHGPSQ